MKVLVPIHDHRDPIYHLADDVEFPDPYISLCQGVTDGPRRTVVEYDAETIEDYMAERSATMCLNCTELLRRRRKKTYRDEPPRVVVPHRLSQMAIEREEVEKKWERWTGQPFPKYLWDLHNGGEVKHERT